MLNGLLADFNTWQFYKFLFKFQFLNSLLDQFWVYRLLHQFRSLTTYCVSFSLTFTVSGSIFFNHWIISNFAFIVSGSHDYSLFLDQF